MRSAYDFVIVGGAVIGSSVAYFLTASPDFTGSVLVVERDPTYVRAATSLSSSSIRMQFSNPINVTISQFGSDFIKGIGDVMQVAGDPRPDLNFHQGGYLFLGNTSQQAQTLCENHAVQRVCRAEGRFFLSGAAPVEDPAVDWDDFEPRHAEFEDIIWPALAARSPGFEAIKVGNQWAGHYDFNTLDHNLIVGPHPEVPNFLFANGFSGHGLQPEPAAGRAVSELITYGGFRTLDLSDVGFDRILAGRPFLEKAVI